VGFGCSAPDAAARLASTGRIGDDHALGRDRKSAGSEQVPADIGDRDGVRACG
jgi:hypothetical protein